MEHPEERTSRIRDELRSLSAKDSDKWYLNFTQWFRENYFAPPPLLNRSLIVYHTIEKMWYHYNESKGFYEKIEVVDIETVFFNWADSTGYTTNDGSVAHAIRRLRGLTKTRCIWDSGEYDTHIHIENILDGLLDRDSHEIFPHSPGYMSKTLVPRHYHQDIIEMPNILKKLYTSTPDWKLLQKFAVAIIHDIHDDEMFIMMYGKRGAGKSTTAAIFSNIFGKDCVSATSLDRFGTQFGKDNCYDKRINVNPDLPIIPLSPKALAEFKKMTGEDGDLDVEIKRVSSFSWPIHVFFIYGINQLMKFSKGAATEIEAMMRRTILIHYPNAMTKDTKFKKSMTDPKVLDQIYSYWVNCEYEPMIQDDELDKWINSNLKKWLLDSEPVLRILQETYIFDDTVYNLDLRSGTPIYPSISCNEVVETVRTLLEEDGFQAPNDLQSDITQAFKTMKIEKSVRRGITSSYLKLRLKTDDDNKKDTTIIQPEETLSSKLSSKTLGIVMDKIRIHFHDLVLKNGESSTYLEEDIFEPLAIELTHDMFQQGLAALLEERWILISFDEEKTTYRYNSEHKPIGINQSVNYEKI